MSIRRYRHVHRYFSFPVVVEVKMCLAFAVNSGLRAGRHVGGLEDQGVGNHDRERRLFFSFPASFFNYMIS
jgi:hypothetical protein